MVQFNPRTSSIPYTLVVPLFTFLGVFAFFNLASWIKDRPVEPQQVFSPTAPTITSFTKQPPTGINIPKLQKNLPVQAAIVKDNEWQLFDTSVAWLATSAVPGEGNVILYAHNWQSLWGDLYKLQPGDEIEIDQNGRKIVYQVTESRAVLPTDIDAILSDKNQLTLYTCEGSFDQKRRVVYAEPL